MLELRENTAWREAGHKTEFDIELAALDIFLQGEDADIIGIPEIWQLIQEPIRETMRELTYDAYTFLERMTELNAVKIYRDKLKAIRNELYDALKRKHEVT